ncbi:hypothetical protein BDV93DRAFT_108399 [Ceratobasidium sp. AG-I]|nr:hypothetical protein BDV93DRAFT_108399 [Ceratobasidium sp. AG-I]
MGEADLYKIQNTSLRSIASRRKQLQMSLVVTQDKVVYWSCWACIANRPFLLDSLDSASSLYILAMETDEWYDTLSLESYRDEIAVVQALDDADVGAEHYGDGESDKRVFKLTDFFMYNKNTMKLVQLDLDNLDHICVAGHAIPITPDDNGANDEESSEAEEEVHEFGITLSAIEKVEYTYLDVSSAGQDGVYLLTSYGWYLLQRPIGFYRVPYAEPFRQFRLVLVIIKRCYEEPEERLSRFVTRFRHLAERYEREYTSSLEWGYRSLHPADLQSSSHIISKNIRYYLEYLAMELHGETDRRRCADLRNARERLVHSKVIQKILEGHLATIRKRDGAPLDPPLPLLSDAQPPAHANEKNAYEVTAEGHESDEEDQLMEDVPPTHRSKPMRRTCVTPLVERTARRVFPNTLNLVGEPLPDVTWRRSRGEGTRLPAATKLKRGQCILVPAGVDEAYPQQDWAFSQDKTTSENPYANDYWFAQVIATTADGQQVHVRWFDHSAKTDLLSYFERPMELFLSRRCGYVARNHVERVVEVKLLEPDEKPPNREQHYYFRFIREFDASFTRARPSDFQLQPPPSTSCHVCDALDNEKVWYENKTLRIGGEHLHKGDYIVINPLDRVPWFPSSFRNSPEARNTPPGQIFRVIAPTRTEKHGRNELAGLLLGSLERVETLRKRGVVGEQYSSCEGRPIHDERRLCLMDRWDVSLELADVSRFPVRKCFVRHPDTFESHEEMNTWLDSSAVHFIVDLQGVHSAPAPRHNDLQLPMVTSVKALTHDLFTELALPCKKCSDESSNPRVTKMRMLDLFSGAGGLSRGLVQSGICEAKYALDHDGAALKTYDHSPGCKHRPL